MNELALAAIPNADLPEFGLLPDRAKQEVLDWMDVVLEFDKAANKAAAAEALAQRYAGRLRLTKSTLYRKREGFHAAHWRGLVNHSLLKGEARLADAVSANRGFVEFWQGLCMDFQRKTAAAYRSLFFDHLCVGKLIPGYGGSWRDIWLRERPLWRVPDGCPYLPDRLTPSGWSSSRLYRLAPDVFQLTAARIGLGEALQYLPQIPTTRRGLRIGQVKLIDDVWHDHKVNFAGNSMSYRPLQLGSLDLFTGFYESFGVKPIREIGLKEKEYIRGHYMRALLVHMLCVVGYHPEGCTIQGEHGTAVVGDDLLRVLQRYAPEISFMAGSIQGMPIAKGMYDVRTRGNFKWKAALESAHNLHHNELAALKGQIGMDRHHAPAELKGRDMENKALVLAALALSDSRPDLLREVDLPYMQFDRFVEFLHLVYERVNSRLDHRLEGFEEAGLTVQEYRLDKRQPWLPMAQLEDMSPAARAAVEVALAENPAHLVNCRRMSPAEAFQQHRHELTRLPISVAPAILGPEFGHKAKVSDRGEIVIKDPDYSERNHVFSAHLKSMSGEVIPLARGREVFVHLLSPMDTSFAFVSDPDGAFIGAAPALVRGTRDDLETLQRNLGLRQQALATELRKLRPYGEQKLRERDAGVRQNLAAHGISDPVADRSIEAEIARDASRIRGARRPTAEFDDAFAQPAAVPPESISDDEDDLSSIFT